MSKDLKEYLPFYIGEDVQFNQNAEFFSGKKYKNNSVEKMTLRVAEDILVWELQVKILLRPLSDMTEEEKMDAPKLKLDKWGAPTIQSMSELLNWLRAHSFDCDQLIENNLAIDKTKIKG